MSVLIVCSRCSLIVVFVRSIFCIHIHNVCIYDFHWPLHSQIPCIPDLHQWRAIVELDLGANQLTSLPPEIRHFESLEVLVLTLNLLRVSVCVCLSACQWSGDRVDCLSFQLYHGLWTGGLTSWLLFLGFSNFSLSNRDLRSMHPYRFKSELLFLEICRSLLLTQSVVSVPISVPFRSLTQDHPNGLWPVSTFTTHNQMIYVVWFRSKLIGRSVRSSRVHEIVHHVMSVFKSPLRNHGTIVIQFYSCC